MTPKDDWNDAMKDLIHGYNEPPEIPREEMWASISGTLGDGTAKASTVQEGDVISLASRRSSPWLVPTLAAAAVLVLGVALGRWSAQPEDVGEVVVVESPAGTTTTGTPFRMVAAGYLAQTEAMLTLFKVDVRTGEVDANVRDWARVLLLQTRVLMESRQGQEPGVQALLEDLELMLVQISGLPGDGDPRLEAEMQWIGEDLEVQAILPRVQAVMPQGPVYAGT